MHLELKEATCPQRLSEEPGRAAMYSNVIAISFMQGGSIRRFRFHVMEVVCNHFGGD